jgi:RND family efflux transporter MFP subunit
MAESWQPPAAFNVVSTLAVLGAAVALTWLAWNYYEYSPWTWDGRVRVYTVQVAPEVSGTVVDLSIKDNQFVHKGDVLFRIEPGTYQNAVKQAEGKLAQARAQASYLVDEAKRRRALSDLAVSREQQENATGVAQAANDATMQATGEMAQAALNLERTEIRSPVNGWVTNLLLQSGGFATTGTTAMTLVNADSFWIEGYFEETQLRRIKVGDPVEAALLAYPGLVVTGHVSGLGRGIDVPTPRRACRGCRASTPCSPGCAWRNGCRSGWSWTTCPARSCCPPG